MNGARVAICLMTVILAACGGGGGKNNPPPPPPAPSALSYPAPPALTRGTAMAALTPTVTGTVTSYSVSPALPAGLTLSTTSGVVSGTPTALAATANYTVTASNGTGSTNATVSLTVNDTVPSIQYAQSQYTWSTGAPVSLTPSSTGGAVVTWSISPALPAGVAINATTGVISGTPTAATAVSGYVVTATNSGGTDTFDLTLVIQNGLLLDLGHVEGVLAADYDGQRILSVDAAERAVLWDASSRRILASRDGVRHTASQRCWISCYSLISLHGDTAVVETPTSLIVLDASDGSPLSVIPFQVTDTSKDNLRWWKLATDGSYVVTALDTQLKVYARDGSVLVTKTNNYLPSVAFAAPGQLRIGNTAAAANVIENVAIPSGTSTLSAVHQGTFHSWFDDGEKFLSNVGTSVWVYSKDVAQLDFVGLTTTENLTGQGNWFWTRVPTSLRVYAVGNSSAPAATYAVGPSDETVTRGKLIALLTPSSVSDLSIIDLSGATPSKVNQPTILRQVNAFAASTASDWIVGTTSGALVGGATGPQLIVYSYGKASSIAADANTIAVATAAERLLVFNATTRALTREIPFVAQRVELGSAGTQLIALGAKIEMRNVYVRVFSLATGNVLQQWSYPDSGGVIPVDIGVASAADVLGQSLYEGAGIFGAPQPYERLVTTSSNMLLWTQEIQGGTRILPSPNGTMIAIPQEPRDSDPFPTTLPTTNLYVNGTLMGALPGRIAGWLDDTRVVVNRMKGGLSHGSYVLDHVEVMSTTGTVLSTPATPLLGNIRVVSANSFYDPQYNQIFDATTGATLFSSTAPTASTPAGAISGPNVIFSSGPTVRMEPR